MQSFHNVILLTQSEAYTIVKENIMDALVEMLENFIDGNEDFHCFDNIHSLNENFKEICTYFKDVCALQVFESTGAEMIILSSNNEQVVILREDYKEELDNISSESIKLDQVTEQEYYS